MQANLTLHDYALKLARDYLRTESLLIEVLDEIDCTLLYRTFGYPSLFTYAVSALGLSEATAYAMISVARKSREVKALREALAAQQLSVSKAAKLVATLDANNAEELIAFAKTHTSREIEAEVAKRQGREKELVRKLEIPVSVLEKLKRAQSVLSTKRGRAVDQVVALEAALEEYLDRHDPVRKADRAMKRKTKQGVGRAAKETTRATGAAGVTGASSATEAAVKSRPTERASESATGLVATLPTEQAPSPSTTTEMTAFNSSRAENSSERRPLSAGEAHAVNARDRGRCTFVDAHGVKCTNDRWIQRHHKIPVSLGGGNAATNLVSLCPFHHDMVHQLGFPIDGQVNWIRERQRDYDSGGPLRHPSKLWRLEGAGTWPHATPLCATPGIYGEAFPRLAE